MDWSILKPTIQMDWSILKLTTITNDWSILKPCMITIDIIETSYDNNMTQNCLYNCKLRHGVKVYFVCVVYTVFRSCSDRHSRCGLSHVWEQPVFKHWLLVTIYKWCGEKSSRVDTVYMYRTGMFVYIIFTFIFQFSIIKD